MKIELSDDTTFYVDDEVYKRRGFAANFQVDGKNGKIYGDDVLVFLKRMMKEMKKGGTFVDVGANVGLFTLMGMECMERCVCFEPVGSTFEALEKNVSANKKMNGSIKNDKKKEGCDVELFNCALSDECGSEEIRIPTDIEHFGLVTLGERPLRFQNFRTERIVLKKLDDFEFDNVDVIKIDTEGWEMPVLLGGEETIRKCRPIMLIEYNAVNAQQCGHTLEEIETFLLKLDYEWKRIGEDDIFAFPKEFPPV